MIEKESQVSPAALWRALRCSISIGVPAMIGAVTGNHEFNWAALGGFYATIADVGGSYPARFAAMALLSVAGAFGLLLGHVSNSHLWSVLVSTILWSFIWSYAGVLGGVVSAFNALVVIIFVCGTATPAQSWAGAVQDSLYLIGGGLWATALALLIWPIDPYRPARMAVGQCYRGLAAFLNSMLDFLRREAVHDKRWNSVTRHHLYAIRNRLEIARVVIGKTRAQHLAENIRGEQLLVLLETADAILAYAITPGEYLKQIRSDRLQRDAWVAFLESWRQALEWVQETATREPIPTAGVRKTEHETLHQTIASADDGASPLLRHLIRPVLEATEVAIDAIFMARTGVRLQMRSAAPVGPGHRSIESATGFTWQTLRDAWSWDSLTLRHAIRVSVVCGVGILVAGALHINHGYWIPMTSVIVLRPYPGATWKRSLERTLGTAAGGVVASVLIFFLRSKLLLAALLFPLSFAAMATLPLSYALYVFFLTPTFVIAAISQIGDWHLAFVRAVDTIIGAGLALPAIYSLLPSWRHQNFTDQLAGYFQQNVNYFTTLEHFWVSPESVRALDIARARRQAGLANNAADDALDQLLNEPRTVSGMREPAATFVTYARRLALSITALHNYPHDAHRAEDTRTLSRLESRLQTIVFSLRRGDVLLNPTAVIAGNGTDSPQFDALEQQTRILENAAARLNQSRRL